MDRNKLLGNGTEQNGFYINAGCFGLERVHFLWSTHIINIYKCGYNINIYKCGFYFESRTLNIIHVFLWSAHIKSCIHTRKLYQN